MAERIGIFGGSFNPIHVGHLVIAEAAWQEFSLRKVLFIPSGDTPNKDMHHIDKNIRYAMVEKAIEGNGHFMISPIERDRQGPSYTVDTIRILQREFGDDYEFYFICGTDAVADLRRGNTTGSFFLPVISSARAARGMKLRYRSPSITLGNWGGKRSIS